MLVPKKNRLAVYKYIFNEGVLCAQKDFHAEKHTVLDVPNLQVIKLMQSMVSRGYVKESFNWQWFYWFLTNEGIQYLREYLGLSEDVIPATLKKKPSQISSSNSSSNSSRSSRYNNYNNNNNNNNNSNFKKTSSAPNDFNPSFRSNNNNNSSNFGRDNYRREAGQPVFGFGRGAVPSSN
eukprot:TRINITY_DN6_c1_g1_i4.p1 TRINITY_DN6_c1_g1~~TRINITY_DN6_c1_g1_i4.p1  ORF type:complete len:179 (-),score=88.65 TRINITY_DN6_c1_g1_i4:193-729(-)